MEKKSIVAEKSFNFSVEIIGLCNILRRNKEFLLANQLLRCGTSIGANIQEARAAQSKKDFTSKMSIASKEARETRYWLLLINKSVLLDLELNDYLSKIDELIRLLTASVKTSSERNSFNT